METTILSWGYIGRMEKKKKATIVFWELLDHWGPGPMGTNIGLSENDAAWLTMRSM